MAATIKELAELMGVTEQDVAGFALGLKVWLDKGYSFEDAIAKNLSVIARMAENIDLIPKQFVVDTFFRNSRTQLRTGNV